MGEITKFFINLMARKFSDAERAIKSVKEKPFDDDEFKKGYLTALEGILLSSRSGDSRDFLNRAPFDPKSMKKYRRDFSAFIKNGIHAPFDLGYFSAWSDFLNHRFNSGS
jgi:hypothetical protein